MSRKRRHRTRAHRQHDDSVFGVKYAATAVHSHSEIEEAKQATHDSLIAELGARRRGGVRWWVIAPENVHAFLAEESVRTGSDNSDLLAWFADHPGGGLVVAGAEAVPPDDAQVHP